MRILAPALLLLLTSCGRDGQGTNQGRAPAGEGGPEARAPAVPAIAIAAAGQGGCSASWDGQAVTPAQIQERSIALLERAIGAVGGVQNITEDTLPVFNVAAPADLSFACADTILFSIQRAGVPGVRLIPPGRAPVLADFPLGDNAQPPPVPMEIGVGAGGRVTWNGAPIGAEGLAARLRQVGSDTGPETGEPEAPPGGLELRPTREATFGQVYEVLGRIRARQVRPLLILPSAEIAAPGAAPAPPPAVSPPPPPPPVPPPPGS